MSGPISDMPVIICRECGAFYVLDARMYTDPDTCLVCGAEVGGVSAGIYFESLFEYDENGDLMPKATLESTLYLDRLLFEYDGNGDIIPRAPFTGIAYDTCFDYDGNADVIPQT